MKEEKWGTLQEFHKLTGICPVTTAKYIRDRRFPRNLADYNYGKENYGQKRYYIKVQSTWDYMRAHKNNYKVIFCKHGRKFL